jgi:hypothetical protein
VETRWWKKVRACRGRNAITLSEWGLVARSFTEKPEGSNSMKQELSVNRRTKRRLWVI